MESVIDICTLGGSLPHVRWHCMALVFTESHFFLMAVAVQARLERHVN